MLSHIHASWRSGEQFQQLTENRKARIGLHNSRMEDAGRTPKVCASSIASARVLCETLRASPRWRGIPKPTWLIKPERSDPGFKWVSYIPRRGRSQIWSRSGCEKARDRKTEGKRSGRSRAQEPETRWWAPPANPIPSWSSCAASCASQFHIFRASFEFKRTRKTGLFYLKVSWLTSTSSLLINFEELSLSGFYQFHN